MLQLLFALALSLAARPSAAAPVADYSGHWSLDRVNSTGLPPYYARVRKHELQIAQTATALDVLVTIDVGEAAPDTIRLAYRLDGQTTHTEMMIRTPDGGRMVPTDLQAEPLPNGGVHIVITRMLPMPGEAPVRGVTTEDWSLGADGQTLTVHRVDEMPRGKAEAEMVFRRG